MSPTGESAVSLSREKVQVKRDPGGAGRWVGSGGGAFVVEELAAPGTRSLSSGPASQRVRF